MNPPTTIRAFLFDLDGTLIDSEILWVTAVRTFLNDRAEACSQAEAEALVYGRSWSDIHADITRTHPALAMSAEDMDATLHPYYKRVAEARDIRIPGSIALLKRLARDNPVCVVSGSPHRTVGDAVTMLGLGDDLAFYLGAEDYSPGKPDPACFLLAASKLGVPPESCVVFEDSTAGIRAARAAGMRCVALALPNRPPQDTARASLILRDLGTFDPAQLR